MLARGDVAGPAAASDRAAASGLVDAVFCSCATPPAPRRSTRKRARTHAHARPAGSLAARRLLSAPAPAAVLPGGQTQREGVGRAI